MPDRLDHLDDAGDARGGLGMADVRFDRAEPQRPVIGPVAAVGGQQSLGFDGVTEGGAGAVGFDRVDVGGGEAGVREGLLDDPLLGRAARRGETVAGAVLVDGAAADHGEYRVAEAPGVREPFQQDDSHALGPGGAVGRGGERLAPAVGGQPALPAELGEHARGGHHRGSAGQGQRAFPPSQRLAGQMDGHQGRGACGVDGDRWSFQSQTVGDPARGDTVGTAGQEIAFDAVGRLVQAGTILLLHRADEHPGSAALQGCRVDTGPLDGLP